MKVMNYTTLMNKTFHPLLVPTTLGELDTFGSFLQELSSRGLDNQTARSYESTACERWLIAYALADPSNNIDIFFSEASGVIPKLVALEKYNAVIGLTSKVAAAVVGSGATGLASEKILRELEILRSPLVFHGGGTCTAFTGELVKKIEKDEVANLRQEVDGLKQQVAYLTGLAKLRAEPVPDPLAAAKARGASYKTNELANPDNLNLVNASKYAGRSDRVINMERKRGWLYALVPEGNTRGYRYPKWQFDVPASRLRAILDILTPSSLSCWSLHNFLTRPHSDLDGKSPSAALADSTFAIERIIDVARRRVDLQQGAS
jgi:hypothetical protein